MNLFKTHNSKLITLIMSVFLLALPAGAIADVVDRRQMLMGLMMLGLVQVGGNKATIYVG